MTTFEVEQNFVIINNKEVSSKLEDNYARGNRDSPAKDYIRLQ